MTIEFEVIGTTIPELLSQPMGKESIKKMLGCGGFLTAEVTEEARVLCAQHGMEVPSLGVKICYLKEIEQYLSAEQFDAIMTHEKAHVELGHAQRAREVGVATGVSVWVDLEAEKEADAAAAKKYGGEFVIGALHATIHAIGLIAIDLFNTRRPGMTPPPLEEIIAEFVEDKTFQQRIAALKNI